MQGHYVACCTCKTHSIVQWSLATGICSIHICFKADQRLDNVLVSSADSRMQWCPLLHPSNSIDTHKKEGMSGIQSWLAQPLRIKKNRCSRSGRSVNIGVCRASAKRYLFISCIDARASAFADQELEQVLIATSRSCMEQRPVRYRKTNARVQKYLVVTMRFLLKSPAIFVCLAQQTL